MRRDMYLCVVWDESYPVAGNRMQQECIRLKNESLTRRTLLLTRNCLEYWFLGGEWQHRVAQFVPLQVHLYTGNYIIFYTFLPSNRLKCRIKGRKNGPGPVLEAGCAEQVLESTLAPDEWSAAVCGSAAAASVARTDGSQSPSPRPARHHLAI